MKISIMLLLLSFLMVMMMISQKLVSMGGILLTSALLTTFLIGILIYPWYSFILFLVYVSGLLVLFGYFLALSPNNFSTAKNCMKAYVFMFTPFFFSGMKFIQLPMYKSNFEGGVLFMINKMNLPIYWMMVTILLLILLMVVSLTFKTPSPLRHYI